jgi:hypothetical protein
MEGKIGLFPPYLDAGATGAAVRFLQKTLFGLGCAVSGLVVDSDYTNKPDGKTVMSVKRLQRRVGLRGSDVDGNLGPKTRRFCKEKGVFDFDAIPLNCGSDLNSTEWCHPERPGEFQFWPPKSEESTS